MKRPWKKDHQEKEAEWKHETHTSSNKGEQMFKQKRTRKSDFKEE